MSALAVRSAGFAPGSSCRLSSQPSAQIASLNRVRPYRAFPMGDRQAGDAGAPGPGDSPHRGSDPSGSRLCRYILN
jgi:hypothetical protein